MQFGYFDDKNKEYVVTNPATPTAWVNYLGADEYCALISANAGGYSFFKTPKNERITRYRFNSLPPDRPGRYLYISENKNFWSLSWQPVGIDLSKYKTQTRIGMGYTKIISEYQEIKSESLYFVPVDMPLEIWDIKLKNLSTVKRTLDVVSYVEFAFWSAIQDLTNYQYTLSAATVTHIDGVADYSLGQDRGKSAYVFTTLKPDAFIGERDLFIGPCNDESRPDALTHNKWPKTNKYVGGNPVGIFKSTITLSPGEELRFAVVLGPGKGEVEGVKHKQSFADLNNVSLQFDILNKYWDEKLGDFQAVTPDPVFNSSVNIWNIYQAHTTFNWSRSTSTYETGTTRDGLGFRDSCQDTFSVVHSIPGKVKTKISQLASAIYKNGSACHLFQPIEGIGDGGGFSDDHLWLVLAVDAYLKESADFSFLKTTIPYFDGGEDSLYNHLKSIIDFSLKELGVHNISTGLKADWNDCLNFYDKESVFTSELLYKAMLQLKDIAAVMDDTGYSAFLENRAAELKTAINTSSWDGQWYIRGFTSDGKAFGSKENKEGQIFLESNTWAVISGIADIDRAKASMESVYKMLYTKYGIKLLAPAYQNKTKEIGLSIYPPGLKENAAIFCHAHSWAIVAEALLGNTQRAFEYFMSVCPAMFNDIAGERKTEPYVYSQYIASDDSLNFGEARNSWLTGTASWMYVAATQYILGIRPELNGLLIDPCIPKEWPGFEATRNFRNAKYKITVDNNNKTGHGIKEIQVDNKLVKSNLIPAFCDDKEHHVKIVLGK